MLFYLDNRSNYKSANEDIFLMIMDFITGKMALESGTSVRMLSKERPSHYAQAAEPKFQDAYMYMMVNENVF